MPFPQRLINLFEASAATTRDGIITGTFAERYILEGKAFSVETVFTVGSADTEYDIVFDTTSMTRQLISVPTFWSTSAGAVLINLGSCTSYTGGTEIEPLNRNYAYASAYPSQTVFKYDITPTGFAAGRTNLLVGSAATQQSSGGGSYVGVYPIVLETGINYIFRVNNQAGEEIKLFAGIEWVER